MIVLDAYQNTLFYASLPINCDLGSPTGYKNLIFYPYHKIIKKHARNAWSTDEDEFGLICINLEDLSQYLEIKLPVNFPMQRSGGDGATREFDFGIFFDNMLFCYCISPYSSEYSWGNNNYIFCYAPEQMVWLHLEFSKKNITVSSLSPDDMINENSLNGLKGGRIRFHRENDIMKIEMDVTPYHLDDWVHHCRAIDQFKEREPSKDCKLIKRMDYIKKDENIWLYSKKIHKGLFRLIKPKQEMQYEIRNTFKFMKECDPCYANIIDKREYIQAFSINHEKSRRLFLEEGGYFDSDHTLNRITSLFIFDINDS